MTEPHPLKGKTGLRRIMNAVGYSLAGLRAAYHHECAFRQEVWLAVVMIPLGFYLGDDAIERALMAGAVLLVLIVELLNSGLEATLDRISFDHHLLIQRAKDIGSAAVMLALLNVVMIWTVLLFF